MMDEAPVPKPRPLPPTPPSGSPSRKPVPLPRLKSIFSKDESTESNQSSPKQSMAQLFRDDLIGKHTRRLARNIIPKRFTSHYENTKEPKESPPEENRHSLPISLSADHIFNSISFASPLRDNDSDSESTCSDVAPPLYPPPPPPDDIDMEDSFKEIDSIYEQLRLKDTGDTASKPILRSDSWSFYDTIGSEKSESGSNLYVPLSTIRPCTSGSVGSELSALDMTDGSPSSSRLKWDTESESSGTGSADYREKATKSVLLEFDPLCGKTSQGLSHHDLMIIAGLLPAKSVKTSNYGRVNVVAAKDEEKCPQVCLLEESDEEGEKPPPPPPPVRFDSISPTTECAAERVAERKLEEEEPVLSMVDEAEGEEEGAIMPVVRPSGSADGDTDSARFSLKNHWPSMKKVIKLTRKESKHYAESLKAYVNISQLSSSAEKNPSLKPSVERPVMEPHLAVQYSGHVYRPGSYSTNLRSRELQKRWCSLSESKLTCTADKSSSSNRDVIPLDTVLSVQLVADHRTDADGETVYCFEVNTSGKVRSHLIGVTASLERRMWMQKILENFTVAFPSRVATGYTRFGWCYLKEGIGGSWVAAWILLYQRSLQYCPVGGKVQEADLRKVRSIALQEPDSVAPIILLDFAELTLYLRTEKTPETTSWRTAIRTAATDNGPELQNQQMTQNDVPVIVDKCLKFVDAHGAMSEGIYRRSGANTNVTKLLTKFREDAWAVQLSREEFSEYDVASVLKRFFRDLPEPLLTTELHPELCQASMLLDTEERILKYKELLNKLPLVQRLTLRRLLAHLQFIHELNEYNLMPIDNLAAVWGPTLMHVESTAQLQNCLSSTFRVKNGEITWSQHESRVVMELITLYPRLFTVEAAEVERNSQMRNILKRFHTGRVNPQQSKPTGDLMVWVHIGSKESGNCVQITVGPQKLCGEVCTDLCSHLSVRPDEVVLEEMVLGGHLKRILHYSESVLDTVLRWGYWDEADRRDNYLVLRADNVLRTLQALSKFPLTKSGELRFADQKTKSFKTYLFEFSKAKLCYYKDKRGATKLAEWPIEDIVWYEGHEAKRSPNTSWSLTFINRKNKLKRTKDSPYFGCTLGGTTEEDKNIWMVAFFLGQYPQGLVQPFVAKDLLM